MVDLNDPARENDGRRAMRPALWALVAISLWFWPPGAMAQNSQCRTAPVGTSTANCASEAFVTNSIAPVKADVATNTSGIAANTSDIAAIKAAWVNYTPALSAQVGTITLGTVTGRYLQIGKTIICTVDVRITTSGTAAQGAIVTLPFSAASFNYIGASFEYGSTGKSGAATIIPAVTGAAVMTLRDATGATYFASGAKFSGTVVYEIP